VYCKYPQNDPPEIFKLHALADVKPRRDQANAIFQTIIDIQPEESSAGGMTREDIVLRKLMKCYSMFQNISILKMFELK
jgi:dynein heavy chain